ncbi:MAG: hypothetical protein P8107_00640 [Spirochaetia bacterium]
MINKLLSSIFGIIEYITEAPLDHLILKMEYLARSLDELEEY